MSEYIPTIGLEVHAELATKTKMFSASKNDPDETNPNVNVSPIDLAHPGTLPTINKEAVKHVLKVGLAVGGKLADFTEFDRKNYFYPDIPKGYQISQYAYPLVTGGGILGVDLTRIHLEEDTGTSLHEEGDYSLVNYNRAGVPLMELVTEPVIHDAETAGAFARELQLLLRFLGAGEANMEKGEMRVEANISISKKEGEFGTKVEVKNLNSFKSVEKAIAYELKRQEEVLESGGEVIQETRGWDEAKQETFSQRKKEGSADYRYFPDPDLPKLHISEIPEFAEDVLRKEIPELPWEKRESYKKIGLGDDQVETLLQNRIIGDFFDQAIKSVDNDDQKKVVANYLTSDLVGLGGGQNIGELSIKAIIELSEMVTSGDVSSRGAKDVLKIMYEEGGNPKEIATKEGFLQVSDQEAMEELANKIIEENKEVAEEYKAGKETSLKYLVGQGMKESKGSANPQILEESLKKIIG